MDGRPGKTRRLGGVRVEMQGIVVAGDHRITGERVLLERSEILRADLISGLRPVRRRSPMPASVMMAVPR